MDQSRSELVETHLPLVEQIVLRTSANFPRFVDRNELIAAGTLGLVEAALRYDFDRQVPFSAFAGRRIKGAVMDVARSADWTPRNLRSLEKQVEAVSQELASRQRSTPSDQQIAAQLGVTVSEISRMRQVVEMGVSESLQSRVSIDRRQVHEIADEVNPEPHEVLEQLDMKGYIRAALDSLPERLRLIVIGVYLEERPVEEIARFLGVSSSRVSQLRSDALEMIRHGIESQFEPVVPTRPKGRVEIRQARYAAAIASHSDLRVRLDGPNLTHRTGRLFDGPARTDRPRSTESSSLSAVG